MKKKSIFLATLFALSLSAPALSSTPSASALPSVRVKTDKRAQSAARVVVEQPSPLFVNTSDVESVRQQLPTELIVNTITIVDNEPVIEKDTAPVTWDSFASTDLKTGEAFSLHGTVSYGGSTYDAEIDITLRKIFQIVATDYYVEVGTESYELPTTVHAVYTDGYLEERTDITWLDAKPSTDTKQDHIVRGSVGGVEFEQKVIVYDETNAPSYNISFSATPTVNWEYRNDVNSDPAKIIDGSYSKAIDNWGPQQSYVFNGVTCTKLDTYEVYLTWDIQQTGINKIIAHWLVESNNNAQIPMNLAVAYKANVDDAEWTTLDAEVVTDQTNPNNPNTTFQFFPVNAQQVKISWEHRKEQTGWGTNLYDWTGITEFEAYSTDVPPTTKSSVDTLSSVSIAGTSVPNFQSDRPAYSVTIPYTAIDDPQFDVVLMDDKGQYVLIPGEVDGEAYKVVVIAENLTDYSVYSFYLTSTKAPLEEVLLEVGDTSALIPGAALDLSATGRDVIDRVHDAEDARISYEVTNLSGMAVIEGRTLKAIRSGYVEVQATMTYGDSTLASEAVLVEIQEGEDLVAASIDRQAVTTHTDMAPDLPETALVHYANGMTAELPVEWKKIPETIYRRPGSFVVEGTVEGAGILAECVVTVLGEGSLTQTLTISTVQGKVPSFPTTVLSSMDTAFETSETTLTIPDEYKDASLYAGDVGTTVDVMGTDGNGNPVTIHVDIVSGDTTKDYVENQNGYPNAPHSFAENTNIDETNMNFTNFADTESYYVSKDEGTEAIVGFVMGDANIPQRIEINHLSFDLASEEGFDSDIQVRAQQLNYDLSLAALGDSPEHYAEISEATTDMLRKDENWSDLDAEPTVEGQTYNFDFDYASVSAIRFVITKDEGVPVKLRNVVGTSQTTTVRETLPELATLDVTIGEEQVDLLARDGLKDEYTVDYDGTSPLDVSATLKEGERGSVYVLGNMGDNRVRVLVTSERGNVSQEITINLNVTEKSGIQFIASVTQPEDLVIEKAEDFEKSLPTDVEVTFTDGTTQRVGVTFDTSVFQGKKGTYELTGTLELPPEYINALNHEVRLTVTVQNDLVPDEPTDPEDPTDPSDPSDPSAPTDPSDPSDPSDPTDPETPEEPEGLRGGDIAAIVLGVLLGLTIVGGVAFYFLVYRKKK